MSRFWWMLLGARRSRDEGEIEAGVERNRWGGRCRLDGLFLSMSSGMGLLGGSVKQSVRPDGESDGHVWGVYAYADLLICAKTIRYYVAGQLMRCLGLSLVAEQIAR
jgi:hypothetical protein